jgi:uncharacterized membrane protein
VWQWVSGKNLNTEFFGHIFCFSYCLSRPLRQERRQTLPKVFKKHAVTKEFAVLVANLVKAFQKDFLQVEGRRFRETAAMSLLILIFLTAAASSLVVRVRRYCYTYEKHPFVPTHRWRFLCVRLIRRSIILLGILLVLYSHKIIQFSHYRFPFYQPVFNILLIFLFSHWLLDFLKFHQQDENLSIPQELKPKIHRMTIWVRYFAVVYVVIHWAFTDIRFAIDRLFRERNIETAFPQRDIHIRSTPEDKKDIENLEKGITV